MCLYMLFVGWLFCFFFPLLLVCVCCELCVVRCVFVARCEASVVRCALVVV